jgi:hypothetical protein
MKPIICEQATVIILITNSMELSPS